MYFNYSHVDLHKIKILAVFAFSFFFSSFVISTSILSKNVGAIGYDDITIPSGAYTNTSGYVTYDCISNVSSTTEGIEYLIQGAGLQVTLGDPLSCSSYPNSTHVVVNSYYFNNFSSLNSGSYTHFILTNNLDFEAFVYKGQYGTSSVLYTDVRADFTLINYSHVNMSIYDGINTQAMPPEITQAQYFTPAIYKNQMYNYVLQLNGLYNFNELTFSTQSTPSVLYFYAVDTTFSPSITYWADTDDLVFDIPTDETPLNPIWTNSDFLNGNEIGDQLHLDFSLINPFANILPLFSDNTTFCPATLSMWLNIGSTWCVKSPWPSAVRSAITTTGNILMAILLFGFAISWLRSTSVPFARVIDHSGNSVGSTLASDTPAMHGIHSNKGGFRL